MRAKKLDRMRPRPYHIAFGSLVRGTTQMRYVFYSLAALPVGALTFSAGASDLAVPPAQPVPSDWIITLGADAARPWSLREPRSDFGENPINAEEPRCHQALAADHGLGQASSAPGPQRRRRSGRPLFAGATG